MKFQMRLQTCFDPFMIGRKVGGKTGAKFELMASSQPIYAIVGLF